MAADYGSSQAQGLQPKIDVPSDMVLSGCRVVLVSPKGPLNIGSVIRALANFECQELFLVSPRCSIDSVEIEQMSVGSSHVRERLVIVDTLSSALSDTVSSIGFTRRSGSSRKVYESISSLLETNQTAIPSLSSSSSSSGVTALVFGREESGLYDDEISQCAYACAIPSGRLQPSLNLAAAVTVVLSSLFTISSLPTTSVESMIDQKVKDLDQGRERERDRSASQSEIELLMSKMKVIASLSGHEVQESVGGKSHGRKTKALGHVRNIMQRSRMSENEVRSLHGLASAMIDKLSPGHQLGSKKRNEGGLPPQPAEKDSEV